MSCTEWIYGGENQGSKWCSTEVDEEGIHVNGEGNYGFCGSDCNIDTVSLADILESLIGANARTGIQRNKDSVVQEVLLVRNPKNYSGNFLSVNISGNFVN